jgi:methionyl-tRNA formyltransferase
VSRLVFLGTPAAAVPSLRALVAARHDVALVVSRPDRRRGRGGALTPSPVKAAALELGLDTSDRLDDALGAGAELGVVVAFGRLVPGRVLDALPMVNVHFSLLPRWRGAAPVERAILAGDAETGVCIMRLEEGLDTGPVLGCRRMPIDHAGRQDAADLTAALADAGAALLVETLAGGVAALGPGEPQQGEPTYAAKLEPDEFRLDWARPADELERIVRLGRAWTTFRGQRLRVLRARAVPEGAAAVAPDSVAGGAGGGAGGGQPGALVDGAVVTGAGVLVLEEVQPEGRRPMDASDWRRGVRPGAGERLGASPGAGGGDR